MLLSWPDTCWKHSHYFPSVHAKLNQLVHVMPWHLTTIQFGLVIQELDEQIQLTVLQSVQLNAVEKYENVKHRRGKCCAKSERFYLCSLWGKKPVTISTPSGWCGHWANILCKNWTRATLNTVHLSSPLNILQYTCPHSWTLYICPHH